MKRLLILLPFLLHAQQVDYNSQIKNKPTLSTINGGSLPATGSITKIDGSGHLAAAVAGTDYMAPGGGSALTSLGLGTCATGQVVFGAASTPGCSTKLTWDNTNYRLSLNSSNAYGALAIGAGDLAGATLLRTSVTTNGLLLADGTTAAKQTSPLPSFLIHRQGNEAWGAANDTVAAIHYRQGASGSGGASLLYLESREDQGNTAGTGIVGFASLSVIENATNHATPGYYRSTFAGFFQVQKLANVKNAATAIEINNTNESGANCDEPRTIWTGGGPCFGLAIVGVGSYKNTTAIFLDTQNGQNSSYYYGINEAVDSVAHTGLGYIGYAAAFRRLDITLPNGTSHNIDIKNSGFILITGPTEAFTLTGFTNGQDGRMLTVRNGTTQSMSLGPLTGSSAANQIYTDTFGYESSLGPSTVTLVYEGTSQKWIVVSKSR